MYSVDIKNIRPLTEFRNHIKEYIKELKLNKKPIILTQHGKSALGLDDVKNKRFHSFSEVINDVNNIITKTEKK